MLAMVGALRECEAGMALLEHAQSQLSLRARAWDLPMQARPDWVVLDGFCPVIVDLKTTKNLDDLTKDHGPALWKLNYHSQLALARRLLAENGYPEAKCYILAVEKNGYRSACVEVPDGMLRAGERYFDEHAPKLAECYRTDVWLRAVPGIVKLETPGWMERRAENTVSP